ncbi:MAG: hypothetical protein ACI9KE_005585 [Polyangiales bacterium]
MTREEYPLKAALELRERELDLAKAALAEARRAEAEQEAQVRAAQEQTQTHESLIVETRAAQKHRGVARADELLRDMDYDVRLRSRRGELAGAADAQRALLAKANGLVATRMSDLAKARAENEAVLKHQERWEAERATIAGRRAEAEEDDQNSVRFGKN